MGTVPATYPNAGDRRAFSLSAVLDAHYAHPEDHEARERAENSLNCIREVRAARPAESWAPRPADGGVVVPDELLAHSMRTVRAAVTTRATAIGVEDPRIAYDDIVGEFLNIGEILPYCNVKMGLNPEETLPLVRYPDGTFRTVTENQALVSADTVIGALGVAINNAVTALTLAANATDAVAVGDYLRVGSETVQVTVVTSQASFTVARGELGTGRRAHADAVAVTLLAKDPGQLDTLTGEQKKLSPHTIRGNVRYTPEANVGSRMMVGAIGLDEGIRQMANQVEDQIAKGTGANGQPSGFETLVVAANTRTKATALADGDLGLVTNLWRDASKALVPVRGRVWVQSPEMGNYLYGARPGGNATDHDGATLKGAPLVESTRITESTFAGDVNKGAIWLLYGPDVVVGFFGEDTEVSVQRVNETGDWDVVMIKFWDVQFRRPGQTIRKFVVET